MNQDAIPKEEEKISEGEIYIQEFLEEENIKYIFGRKIDFLVGDNKAYRVADFYIPRYNLYVEFCGRWNKNEEERKRYNEKRNVYDKNNVACIYLYPDNLGWIKYLFNYRAMKELKDRGKKKDLFKLRVDIVHSRNKWIPFRIFLSFFGLAITFLFNEIQPQYNMIIYILCTFLILVDSFSLYSDYRELVKKIFHNI